AISEDQRLAGEINALCIGLTAVMEERENFVDELDVLEGSDTVLWLTPLLLGSLVAIVELVAKSAPVLLKYVFSKRLLDYVSLCLDVCFRDILTFGVGYIAGCMSEWSSSINTASPFDV
ncbi:hypothetical protein Tco_0760135, partial [Tanacetum coccineum]